MNKAQRLVVVTICAAACVTNDYRLFEAAGWVTLIVVALTVGFDYEGARHNES